MQTDNLGLQVLYTRVLKAGLTIFAASLLSGVVVFVAGQLDAGPARCPPTTTTWHASLWLRAAGGGLVVSLVAIGAVLSVASIRARA